MIKILEYELKLATKRFAIAALWLGMLSVINFYLDEIPILYDELDHFIPILWLARFSLLMLLISIIFGMVQPLSTIISDGIWLIKGKPKQREESENNLLIAKKIVSKLLWMTSLYLAYQLLRPLIERVLFPFYDFPWLPDVVMYIWYFVIGIVVLGLIRNVVAAVSRGKEQRYHGAGALSGEAVYCRACGTKNSVQGKFCEKCGNKLDEVIAR